MCEPVDRARAGAAQTEDDSEIFGEIGRRRRDAARLSGANCRVLAAWALNGYSQIDTLNEQPSQLASYGYALVSTEFGLGCCYADRFLEAPADWVGRQAVDLHAVETEWGVALADALAIDLPEPARVYECSAAPIEKSHWRARVLADVVDQAIRRSGNTGPIVIMGAVGAFIQSLTARGYHVEAVDLNPSIIGQTIGGVTVRGPDEIQGLLPQSSLILTTAMAISNHTIDQIITTCSELNLMFGIYGQTASSFAFEYLEKGATFVLAEKFPFFTMPGTSLIHLYDRIPEAAR